MANGFVHRFGGMSFRNSTRLDSARLLRLFGEAIGGWPSDGLNVWVRYSRGADYSGTCFIREGRVLVNLGRHVDYPYRIGTHIARTRTTATGWRKPVYTVECSSAYELAVFVFRHECYHWLLERAGRNGRQKESLCDRFATRYVVERFDCIVRDERGRLAPREKWDIRNPDAFVRAVRLRCPERVEQSPSDQRANAAC